MSWLDELENQIAQEADDVWARWGCLCNFSDLQKLIAAARWAEARIAHAEACYGWDWASEEEYERASAVLDGAREAHSAAEAEYRKLTGR